MKHFFLFGLVTVLTLLASPGRADLPDMIQKVKPSIIVVGVHRPLGSPQFTHRGTGFAIADGNQLVTNAHVLPGYSDIPQEPGAGLVVQVRKTAGDLSMRRAEILSVDKTHDLALLKFEGPPVPPLKVKDSSLVREGESVAFMGFPIGGVLGFSPVTHRGVISAITPIVLPTFAANTLNEKMIRRVKDGTFNIFQLDATAYPGNSGGPLLDPETGEVIGVINMVFVKAGKESVLSQPSGISYAIPANFIANLMR